MILEAGCSNNVLNSMYLKLEVHCFHYASNSVFFSIWITLLSLWPKNRVCFGIKIQHASMRVLFFIFIFIFLITKVILTTTKIAFFSTSYLHYNCVCVVTQEGTRTLVFDIINDLISKNCSHFIIFK